jgi:pimeloyl-ACP methyl ester carboxylesterase
MTGATPETVLRRYPLKLADTRAGPIGYREAVAGSTRADAPALILLHGIGSASASWVWQLESLRAHARIVAWDAPGYGRSAPVSDAGNAGAWADALAALLDALGIGRGIVVGHSLGAIMATAFAASFPERVERMVLAAPAAGYGDGDRALRERIYRERVAGIEESGAEAMAARRSARLLSPSASPRALAWVRWNMAQLNPSGYGQAAALLSGDSVARHAARAAAPAAVIVGADDVVTTPDKCRAVAALWPGTPFRLLQDAGHALHVEAPARFDTMLLGALCLGGAARAASALGRGTDKGEEDGSSGT